MVEATPGSPRSRKLMLAVAGVLALILMALVLDPGGASSSRGSGGSDVAAVRDGSRNGHRRRAGSTRSAPSGRRIVEVRVRSSGGDPAEHLSDATVAVGRLTVEGEVVEDDFREARVDSEGAVTIDDALPGTWGVEVVARGHLGARKTFRLAEGAADVAVVWEIELDRFPRLTLHVRTPEGKLATGARARLIVPQEANLLPGLIAPTDRGRVGERDREVKADGSLLWEILPVGTPLSVICEHREYGRKLVRVAPLSAGQHREIDVALSPHTSIAGRAVPATFEPGAVTTVECWHVSEGGSAHTAEQRVRTDEHGNFRLRAVSPGSKRLVAVTRGNGWLEVARVKLDAEEGVENDAGTLTAKGSTFRLHCQTDESPQPDVPIVVSLAARSAASDDVFFVDIETRAGRTLEFRGLPDGEVVFMGSVPQAEDRAKYEVRELRLQPGATTAEGTLLAVRHRPEKFGLVRVKLSDLPMAPEGQWRASVAVLRDGRTIGSRTLGSHGPLELEIGSLTPGPCRVVIVTWGRVIGPIDAELVAGKATHILADRWERRPGRSGRVVDADGNPVPGVSVLLASGPEQQGRLYSLRTGQDGTFRLPTVPDIPGLIVSTRGGDSYELDDDVDTEIVLNAATWR